MSDKVSRRQKKKAEEGNPVSMERWLLSYADFITLLMIFFILMYSFSQVDLEKYHSLAQSLSVVFTGQTFESLEHNGASLSPGLSGEKFEALEAIDDISANQIAEIQQQIEEYFRNDTMEMPGAAAGLSTGKLADFIEVSSQERGLVISLKDTLLFASGSDQLNPQARRIIKQLGKSLIVIPNHIRVEGHTDNLPINNARIPSNWELSTLRATTVLHVLQGEVGVPPQRLSVSGYGEYRPLADNSNPANRSKNRRVDIVIMKQKYAEF